jgi:hypothetical protein
MKYATLVGIAHTASCMDITVTLGEDGLTFDLSKGMYAITGMVPWPMLETSVDPHGLCACTMGDMFNAMKVAQGVDDDPRVVRPSHWSGTGRAGNGGDM